VIDGTDNGQRRKAKRKGGQQKRVREPWQKPYGQNG